MEDGHFLLICTGKYFSFSFVFLIILFPIFGRKIVVYLFHVSSWTWFELIFSIFKKVFLIHVINNLITLTVYLL